MVITVLNVYSGSVREFVRFTEEQNVVPRGNKAVIIGLHLSTANTVKVTGSTQCRELEHGSIRSNIPLMEKGQIHTPYAHIAKAFFKSTWAQAV